MIEMLWALLVIAGTTLTVTAANRLVPMVFGLVWTAVCAAVGVIGMLALRPLLNSAFNARADSFSIWDGDFYQWAIAKFDRFAIGSLLAVMLILGLLLWVVRRKNERDFVWRHLLGVSYCCMFLLFVGAVWYGIGTVNKLFDLASWICGAAVFECGVLHLPLFLQFRELQRQKKIH